MRRRLVFIAALAATYAASSPSLQGQTTFTSGSGITDTTSSANDAVGWTSITVPANAFPGGTTIAHITVTLTNWSEPNGYGLNREFILQAPSGQTFEFIGNVTGDNGGAASSATYTLDDSAATLLPNTGFAGNMPASGTYKPDVSTSNSNFGQVCENFPASPAFEPSSGVPTYDAGSNTNCAQQTTKGTFGSVFNGLSPFGTWTVWMALPFTGGGSASVQSAAITITPAVAASTTTAVSTSSPNAETFAGMSVTFTATVTSSGSTPTGTVAFQDGNNAIPGCGAVVLSSGQAVCSTALSGEGTHTITATYSGNSNFNTSSGTVNEFIDNQTVQTGSAFCNNGTITLNEAGNGGTFPGSPYPQHVFVSSLTGSITGLTLTLQNVNADLFPLRVLLVGPAGDKFVALSGTGNDAPQNFVGNLVLSDNGGSLVPAGTDPTPGVPYLPTDYTSSIAFPAPAPVGPYKTPGTVGSDTFAATFAQEPVNDPNNDKWSLFVAFNGGVGVTQTIGGYCLAFTTSNLPATTTTIQASPQMQANTGQAVTFTATVTSGGNPVTQGTVKFEESGNVLSGPTALNGSGQAIFQTSSLSEGIHNVEAIYSGVPNAFNVSSATVTEEIDTPTTTPQAGQFCNPGGLVMGTTVNSSGETAAPYPSRINVSGVAGTIQSVNLALNGVTMNDPIFSIMMLEGPTGTNIVFWDDAGGSNPVTSPINILFGDSAQTQLGVDQTPTSGSYQPTANADDPPFSFPATTIANQPPAASYAAPLGTQTFASAFQSAPPDGYWSLFWINRPGDLPASISNWCVNIVNNPPVVRVASSHTGSFTQGDTSDTYTITVANPSGPGSTAGTMTLTDTLPSGMSAVSMSQTAGGTGSDWSCTGNTCTRTSPMAPGETDTITLTVGVGYSTASGTNAVTNSVSVTGGGIAAPATGSDPTTIIPAPIQVTFGTNPSGLIYTVDGTPYSAGTVLSLTNGSTHTIATTSPQGSNGTRETFASWSDGGALSHQITISSTNGTASYTATFNTSYLLTTAVNASADGGVTANPLSPTGDAYYAAGTVVTLTATANTGYSFSNWAGTTNSSTNPLLVTMNGPTSETANFVVNNVNVTVGTNIAGLSFTVDTVAYTSPQNFTWQVGSNHTIATTSPQGSNGTRYSFASWSDIGAISHAVTASSSTTSYLATFNTSYLLTTAVNASADGSVTANPPSPTSDGYYAAGTPVTLTATANTGYSFSNWTGTTNSSTNPLPVTMNSPVSETANFVVNNLNVTVGTNVAGVSFTIDNVAYTSTQNFTWQAGSSHTIATTSPQGSNGTRYTFASWSDSGAISHIVTASSSTTSYVATFNTSYLLTTLVSPPASGAVTPGVASPTGDGYYPAGTPVELTAGPAPTYAFTSWSGSADLSSTTANPTTVTMNAPEIVTANFTLTYVGIGGQVSVTENGLLYSPLLPNPGGGSPGGGTTTFTITNTSGQTISGPIQLLLTNLPSGVTGANNAGTFSGNPFWTSANAAGLSPGASLTIVVQLNYAATTAVSTTPAVYTGSL